MSCLNCESTWIRGSLFANVFYCSDACKQRIWNSLNPGEREAHTEDADQTLEEHELDRLKEILNSRPLVIDCLNEACYNTVQKLCVLSTTPEMQLVMRSVPPEKAIKFQRRNNVTQTIQVLRGECVATINSVKQELTSKSSCVFVLPSNTEALLKNLDTENNLVLCCIYSPPVHEDGASIDFD